jgi:creatinine amidohydrolase
VKSVWTLGSIFASDEWLRLQYAGWPANGFGQVDSAMRDITHLTWMEIRDLEKRNAALVLPVGALEQHGPHLPVVTDLLLVEHFLELALERLPNSASIWRLPAFSFGKSNEHSGFPGTFSLSASTLMSAVRDIARGVKDAGFRRLVLLNSHGGNRAILDTIARDIRAEFNLMVFSVFPPALAPDPLETTELEKKFGIHAGDWETSVMLALAPELVKMDLANSSFPDFQAEHLTLTTSGSSVAWLTRDWNATGTWGDATVATAERGLARLEPVVAKLALVLEEIASFEVPA